MSRQIQDKITFIDGKLNSDIDIELLPKGDSPVDPSSQNSGRLNVIPQEGNLGILTNPKGTTNIADSNNGDKILAWCYDKENDAMIFLVYGSSGGTYDEIIRHYNDGTFETIYNADTDGGITLDFASNEIIHNLYIIGSGTDAQLGWCSNLNPPRLFNISHVLNDEFTSSEDWLNLALTPPLVPPTLTLSSDTSVIQNNIYNKGYQFAVKYIYFDGKESSWSDYTAPFFPAFDYESFDGVFGSNLTAYNRITITYSSIPDGVEKVKIAYRYIETEVGTPSSWYEYDIVDVSSNAITYYFYDDKFKAVTDQTDIAYQAYDVPLYAKDSIFLPDNRIALCNPTIGYDNVDINISLQTVYKSAFNVYSIASTTSITTGTNQNITLQVSGYANTTLALIINSPSTGDKDYIKVNIGSASNDYSYQTVQLINDASIAGVTASRVGTNQINVDNASPYTINVYMNNIDSSECREKSQLAGATHYLAIAYSDDKGRKGRANISTDSVLRIGSWPEMTAPYLLEDNYVLAIAFDISHLAPTWATKWELLWGGSNILYRYQLPLICSSDESAVTADISYTGGYIYLDVNAADDRILALNSKFSTFITFDAQKGDRIRFISKIGRETYPSSSWKISDNWELFTAAIDLEIIDVDEDGVLKVESNITNSELDDVIGSGSYDIVMVEVYRIATEVTAENRIYQSIGQKGSISNRYHQYTAETGSWLKISDGMAFTPRNQTASLSCRGVAVCGGYKIFNHFYDMSADIPDNEEITLLSGIIESSRLSFGYYSEYYGGKINYVDNDHKQRTVREVMVGHTYSEDGLIFDELNKFVDADDYKVYLDDKEGDAYALALDGDTLKVFQHNKISSIGVGVDEVATESGIMTVNIDAILGEPRALKDDYGTIFPKSIASNKRYKYFYDIYKGEFLRNAPNGNESISDYWMKNFWRVRSKALLASGIDNLDICSIYDNILQMVLITVIDNNTSTNSFTLGFHEPSNTWRTFFSFLPELYAKMGETRVFYCNSFNIYEMHVNSTRNNFGGYQYSSYITVVSNPGVQAVFESIHINTNNDEWESPNNTDILIHEDGDTYTDSESYTRHKTKMQSRLKTGRFKFREGLFKAKYLRNMITTSATPTQKDLFKGNILRGRYLKQILRNSDTSEVHLRDVTINSSVSSGN